MLETYTIDILNLLGNIKRKMAIKLDSLCLP